MRRPASGLPFAALRCASQLKGASSLLPSGFSLLLTIAGCHLAVFPRF
jgi:hypothetical protein